MPIGLGFGNMPHVLSLFWWPEVAKGYIVSGLQF